MDKHPILVRRISHLTDARYFAAMGVEWMSIRLTNDPASFMFWHAIRSWVEGVKLAAEVDPTDEELFAKVMIDAKPDGLVIEELMDSEWQIELPCFYRVEPDQINELPYGSLMIVAYDQHGLWQQAAQTAAPGTFYLESSWNQNSLDQVLSTGYRGGICLSGGMEVEIGIRDYEKMDELFSSLIG